MKIKEWFKSLNLKKINSFYATILAIILTALMMTFWNNVIFDHWIIILSVFVPVLFLYFLSYLFFYLIYKKKDKCANEQNK